MFKDRKEAGELLAAKLLDFKAANNIVILVVSDNGKVIGQTLANCLNCPLIQAVSNLKNKIVIVTDDGVVTGQTIAPVLKSIWPQSPQKVIVAVPVIAKETLPKIQNLVDEVIFLESPELFISLEEFYEEF